MPPKLHPQPRFIILFRTYIDLLNAKSNHNLCIIVHTCTKFGQNPFSSSHVIALVKICYARTHCQTDNPKTQRLGCGGIKTKNFGVSCTVSWRPGVSEEAELSSLQIYRRLRAQTKPGNEMDPIIMPSEVGLYPRQCPWIPIQECIVKT